jgi:hypothetical protein
MGHGAPMETVNTYSHLWPTDGERTRAVVEKALRRPQARQSRGLTADFRP